MEGRMLADLSSAPPKNGAMEGMRSMPRPVSWVRDRFLRNSRGLWLGNRERIRANMANVMERDTQPSQ